MTKYMYVKAKSYKTVKFNRKPITITGNLAVLLFFVGMTMLTIGLINIFG